MLVHKVASTDARERFELFADQARGGEIIEVVRHGKDPVFIIPQSLMSQLVDATGIKLEHHEPSS